jgi:hypothetical protein
MMTCSEGRGSRPGACGLGPGREEQPSLEGNVQQGFQ